MTEINKGIRLPLLLIGVLILLSCGYEDETGPAEVRWDRVSCELCRMAISDHYFSAQIRGGEAGKRTKVYYFDDLGCAVLWAVEQDWKEDPRTEIWVTDFETGEWIDARKAFYTQGNITPMDFGLGATPQEKENTLNYKQAIRHIYHDEERKQQNRSSIEYKPLSQDKDVQ